MGLTEVEFWDNYWSKVQIPVKVDMTFSFERCLAATLKEVLGRRTGQVLEIGCAPGKWMTFMADNRRLLPSGIEYSPVGVQITKQNMDSLKIEYGFIKDGDFFSIPPESKFDVVISLGFIEHFDNPDLVIQRHLQWLKKDGLLIIGVPNFRGIYGVVQEKLDKKLLDKHNLNIMNKQYFKGVADKYNLQIDQIKYLGSFEPSLFIIDKHMDYWKRLFARIILKGFRILRKPTFWDGINHPFISSYLLASYIKR